MTCVEVIELSQITALRFEFVEDSTLLFGGTEVIPVIRLDYIILYLLFYLLFYFRSLTLYT